MLTKYIYNSIDDKIYKILNNTISGHGCYMHKFDLQFGILVHTLKSKL